MAKTYVLPCAGYDRPGGEVTRAVADLLGQDSDVVVGSVAALSTARPGELRVLRAASVVALDGCGMDCATRIAEEHGARELRSVRVTDHAAPSAPLDERAAAVLTVVRELMSESIDREVPSRPAAGAGASAERDIVVHVDKFKLTVRRGYLYSDNDIWVSVEGDTVRVGASDLLQQAVSDIYLVDLADVGTVVELGDDAGSIESTKTALEIVMPLSGKIVGRNERLLETPELVNESPYDEGWFYVMEPADPDELELLRPAEDYARHASKRAAEELGHGTG